MTPPVNINITNQLNRSLVNIGIQSLTLRLINLTFRMINKMLNVQLSLCCPEMCLIQIITQYKELRRSVNENSPSIPFRLLVLPLIVHLERCTISLANNRYSLTSPFFFMY